MAASSDLRRKRMAALTLIGLLTLIALTLLAIAGSSSGSRVGGRGRRTTVASRAGTFSWLVAAPAPKMWTSSTIPSRGATLSYPAGWKMIPGDSGTVSAALRDARGSYLGYLNVTPRQGAEQLAGWTAFRTRRNAQDGDQAVRVVYAAENLRFGNARESCLVDDYLSRVGSHAYREVACLVAGPRFTNVFVGAALLADWSGLGSTIERSAAAFSER